MLNISMMLMPGWVTGLIGVLIGLVVATPSTFFVLRKVQKDKSEKDKSSAKNLLEEAKAENA